MADQNILNGLNPQQKEAVITTEGPLLILAGAGSGKTTVLTKRIAWILDSNLAQRSQILGVTFTNKAAAEMIERISNICGKGFFPNVGTFHSVCARWLRREAKYLDVSASFSIYDADSQISLMRDILRDLNVDSDKFRPRDLLSRISLYKNHRRGPADLSDLISYEREIRPIYQEYNQRLVANDSLDFDDILLYTVNLFKNNPEVCEKYRSHIHYIMVDEFQDVNPLQYELLQYLIGPEKNFCAVGDDDQSIYGFRGADISIILRFEKDFEDAKIVKLEQNYRSTQQILDVANCVVSNNTDRKSKHLWSNNTEGLRPFIYLAYDGRGEARFVVDACKKLVRACGYRYSDIAILYRTNFQSRCFEEVLLREEGISYEIVGGRRFYDRREIRDIMAYMRILANPADSSALGRIVSCTPGIGESTYNKVMYFAAHNNLPIMHAMALADRAGVSAALAGKCRRLYEGLQKLAADALSDKCRLSVLYKEILELSGYRRALEDSEKEEDKNRIENIDELEKVLKEFDHKYLSGDNYYEDIPLREFLSEAALLSQQDELEEDYDKKDKLVMMTIHTSKGLEFPIVFLVGLEEGLLPHSRSAEEGEKGVEEERRLCYVGLTRAKDMLYITCAVRRNDFNFSDKGFRDNNSSELSRFLYEMPLNSIDIKADRRSELADAYIKKLQSGEGFRSGSKKLKDKHSSTAEKKAAVKAYNADYGMRQSKKKLIMLNFPPGKEIRHNKYGTGFVSFIAGNKIWMRFKNEEYSNQIFSFEYEELKEYLNGV